MEGQSSGNTNWSFLSTLKYKVSAILILIIVAGEIYTVQRWENSSAINIQEYKTDSKIQYTDVGKYVKSAKYDVEKATMKNNIAVQDKTEKTMQVDLKPQKQPGREPGSDTEDSIVEKPIVFEDQKNDTKGATDVKKRPKHYTYAVKKYLELEDELKKHLAKATDKKIILTWVPMFGVKDEITLDQEKCGNCEVTYDRSKVSDEKTGAVVFHFDAIKSNDMPQPRNLKQLHIYWALESSATLKVVRRHSLQFENNYPFNDTMTYRRDSGFYHNYDHSDFSQVLKPPRTTPEELLQQKNKLAVAVVSNCGYTPGARIRMSKLKEIKSLGLALDGFGGCFPGGRKFAGGKTRTSKEFYDAVRKYKFYFSFENSFHCKDYISEKFLNNALVSLTVPVVWGGTKEDYLAVAPPGSFIFADDFPSMKELADYLKYLDSNDTAYMEYLRWVTMDPEEMPQYGRAQFYCQICRALHGINIDDIYNPKYNESNPARPLFTDGIAPRTMNRLIDWIYGEDNKKCFNP